MSDSFEKSLKDLLNDGGSTPDNVRLDKVLKKASRQVGSGDLLHLIACWPQALKLAFSAGEAFSRHSRPSHSSKK